MPVRNLGEDQQYFQKIMGRGGMIGSTPRPVQTETKRSETPLLQKEAEQVQQEPWGDPEV